MGGTVINIVRLPTCIKVEVLDLTCCDRQFRTIEKSVDIQKEDTLWWQSHTGYLSREGLFHDRNIGPCIATNYRIADQKAAKTKETALKLQDFTVKLPHIPAHEEKEK